MKTSILQRNELACICVWKWGAATGGWCWSAIYETVSTRCVLNTENSCTGSCVCVCIHKITATGVYWSTSMRCDYVLCECRYVYVYSKEEKVRNITYVDKIMLFSLRLGVRSHCERREERALQNGCDCILKYLPKLMLMFYDQSFPLPNIFIRFIITLFSIFSAVLFSACNMTRQQWHRFGGQNHPNPNESATFLIIAITVIIITSHSLLSWFLEAEVDFKYRQWQMSVLNTRHSTSSKSAEEPEREEAQPNRWHRMRFGYYDATICARWFGISIRIRKLLCK